MKDCTIALVTQNSLAGNFNSNLNRCIRLTHIAREKHADIAVFPEMNLTGYLSGEKILDIAYVIESNLTEPLTKLSSDLDIILLVGIARRSVQGNIFASHLVFFPDGRIETYDKIHTAPFEKKYFTQGEDIKVFKTKQISFGVQLCYDAHFPGLSTAMAKNGADVIFMPHASPRGSSMEKYESWLRHLTARAFDNGVFIAACNQTGDNQNGLYFPGLSLVIGPDGKVIDKRLDSSEGVLAVTLNSDHLADLRNHRMKYFLPNSRPDLY